MRELRVDAPDELLSQLRRRAEAKGKSVEEIVLEDIRRGVAADVVPSAGRADARMAHEQLRALAEAKLGGSLAGLVRPVSEERRRVLAEKAAVGRPLSELIIADRGE